MAGPRKVNVHVLSETGVNLLVGSAAYTPTHICDVHTLQQQQPTSECAMNDIGQQAQSVHTGTGTNLSKRVVGYKKANISLELLGDQMQTGAVLGLLVTTQGDLHHLILAEKELALGPLLAHVLEERRSHVFIRKHEDARAGIDGQVNCIDELGFLVFPLWVRLRQVDCAQVSTSRQPTIQ